MRGESDTPETPEKSNVQEDRVSFKSAIRDELLTLLKDPSGQVRDTLTQVISDQLLVMNVITASTHEERILVEEKKIMDQMRALIDSHFNTKINDACGELLKVHNEKINEIERQISEIDMKVHEELKSNIKLNAVGESLAEKINGLSYRI